MIQMADKMRYPVCLALWAFLLPGMREAAADPPELRAVQAGTRIDLYAGPALLTSYRFAADEKYPFFFPVNAPSGAGVTSMRNGLYPHHSSLFFGCDQVNGGNYWQEGQERGQILSLHAAVASSTGKEVVITDECIWKRPGAPAPIRDRRRFVITAPEEDQYHIDFDITLDMLEMVVIGQTNHSLFSVRMDPDLSVTGGGTMVNAEGASGERETFGKPSPWMDCSGMRMGKPEGLAILQHPSNLWFPAPWFTRDYGFMSPTPLNWLEDSGGSITFGKGESVRLRYRVVVHAGDAVSAGIAAAYREYCRE